MVMHEKTKSIMTKRSGTKRTSKKVVLSWDSLKSALSGVRLPIEDLRIGYQKNNGVVSVLVGFSETEDISAIRYMYFVEDLDKADNDIKKKIKQIASGVPISEYSERDLVFLGEKLRDILREAIGDENIGSNLFDFNFVGTFKKDGKKYLYLFYGVGKNTISDGYIVRVDDDFPDIPFPIRLADLIIVSNLCRKIGGEWTLYVYNPEKKEDADSYAVLVPSSIADRLKKAKSIVFAEAIGFGEGGAIFTDDPKFFEKVGLIDKIVAEKDNISITITSRGCIRADTDKYSIYIVSEKIFDEFFQEYEKLLEEYENEEDMFRMIIEEMKPEKIFGATFLEYWGEKYRYALSFGSDKIVFFDRLPEKKNDVETIAPVSVFPMSENEAMDFASAMFFYDTISKCKKKIKRIISKKNGDIILEYVDGTQEKIGKLPVETTNDISFDLRFEDKNPEDILLGVFNAEKRGRPMVGFILRENGEAYYVSAVPK